MEGKVFKILKPKVYKDYRDLEYRHKRKFR